MALTFDQLSEIVAADQEAMTDRIFEASNAPSDLDRWGDEIYEHPVLTPLMARVGDVRGITPAAEEFDEARCLAEFCEGLDVAFDHMTQAIADMPLRLPRA